MLRATSYGEEAAVSFVVVLPERRLPSLTDPNPLLQPELAEVI